MDGKSNAAGIWSARGGDGEELVLLLHGLAANAAVFSRLVPLVEASGRRWITPDLRGHGRASCAASAPRRLAAHRQRFRRSSKLRLKS